MVDEKKTVAVNTIVETFNIINKNEVLMIFVLHAFKYKGDNEQKNTHRVQQINTRVL